MCLVLRSDIIYNTLKYYAVEEECCRAGALFALERPTEPLLCRTDPALTCDSKRDDLCCECCNFGTLSYAAAKEVGCEVNKAAFAGDCQVVFEECCYGRGKFHIDKHAAPVREMIDGELAIINHFKSLHDQIIMDWQAC